MGVALPMVPLLMKIGTPAFRRWVVDIFPSKSVHRLRDIIDLMNETAKKILEGKKAALTAGDLDSQEQLETGTNIMSILRAWLHSIHLTFNCSYRTQCGIT